MSRPSSISRRPSTASTPPVDAIEIVSENKSRPGSSNVSRRKSLQPSSSLLNRPGSNLAATSQDIRAKARQMVERRASERVLIMSEKVNDKENVGIVPLDKVKSEEATPKKKQVQIANDKKTPPMEGAASTPPSVTPYWRALEMDQRTASPRITRSSTKKKKPTDRDDEADDNSFGNALFAMTFSPPNQTKNAIREKKEQEMKERERLVFGCKTDCYF